MTSDQRQTIISRLQSNPNAFQHLETFNLTDYRFFEHSDSALWKVLCLLRVPFKHLTLNTTTRGKVDDSYSIYANRILQEFSKTFQRLSVIGFIYNARGQGPTIELSSYYPLLTNLCINGSNVFLDLDDLLGKCVALKQLKVGGKKLLINSDTITKKSKPQHHGLKVLTLEKCSADAKVFNHISFRYRSLKHMTLNTLHVMGPICEKAGCLLLDMAQILSNTLCIDQLYYSTEYGEFGIKCNICRTLLSQLYDAPLSDEKKKFHNIDWLNTYEYYWSSGIYRRKATKLSNKGAKIAYEYYQNFQSKKIGQTLNHGRLCYGGNPEIGYKYKLYRGYGELRLGKIKDVNIICVSDDNE
ncbi:hypothetical protein J3Q64DRAFT_1860859 [Phycomyces blakesleeanus]|uniref:F-box domain-containing protein n=2 Tax=Phycomyces blakesleeanus TaxID=4837 RepID=A0A167MQI6_PHYB8|nr:hypothetical protein PHYBLDRAFT_63793 [Phycomyces blakesleeanus NRRL 1555(-)]OAD73546.1 hypothetical protein PHYBLDRAFT_63793 [Phycomyces blakesleeanus NRRL 1555(-)]|eukprot:XP_018291586.1 hypothetical protein PHYBLDRAFT_63793 [Phycomyces blakesleeanus NRRL 1555(-)]